MIDLPEIKAWIARLETEESSWSNYDKLAVLYAILNQHTEQEQKLPQPVMYSAAPAPETVSDYGDSDFLQAVSGADAGKAWAVMDELMDTLKVVNQRVYDSVMRKLRNI